MHDEDLFGRLQPLLEILASIEHERWAHWQRYVHERCTPVGQEGDLVIPGELVKRWVREMNTPYSELPEEQKESDREQVRKYLPVILDALDAIRG